MTLEECKRAFMFAKQIEALHKKGAEKDNENFSKVKDFENEDAFAR